METLADVLARDRRGDAPALAADGRTAQRYDYRRFLTTAWKAGNFLHKQGVRTGDTVAVVGAPRAQPVLAFLGASLLGAMTRFDPPTDVDARALVAPADELHRYDLPAGAQYVGYGDDPTDPAHWYWEKEVWSENPTMPPEPAAPDDPILDDGERTYSHADLLSGARWTRGYLSLSSDDRVVVRARLSHPGTVAAGVVAPLLVGAAIRLEPADEGVVVVESADAETDRSVRVEDVPLSA
ncbi:AMP-binding protein [Haloarchaeobius sp. HRN-SO-5]|uniref:AMP-binding protein n=1 Tax=Haloarchaeobius sp. HRN-SO-5 TaxID=3446118 RepID=UPI003EBFFD66